MLMSNAVVPKLLRSDPNLKKIKSERYRDPNYVQTVCKEIYFTTVFSNLYKKRPKLKNLLTIPIHATPEQIQNGSTTDLKC